MLYTYISLVKSIWKIFHKFISNKTVTPQLNDDEDFYEKKNKTKKKSHVN